VRVASHSKLKTHFFIADSRQTLLFSIMRVMMIVPNEFKKTLDIGNFSNGYFYEDLMAKSGIKLHISTRLLNFRNQNLLL